MAITVKEILDTLAPEQKKQLSYAFEHGFAAHITLPHDRYVGVNVGTIKSLIPELVAGSWSTGRIDGKKR